MSEDEKKAIQNLQRTTSYVRKSEREKSGNSSESPKKQPKKSGNKSHKKTWKIVRNIFLVLVVLGLIVAVIAGVWVKGIIDKAPEISFIDVIPEGYTTIIYDENQTEVQQLHGEDANRIYVDLDQIPMSVQNAFISIEDERFWKHNGIDIRGIFRAIFRNLKSGDLTGSGASTITQQLVKNNVLSMEKKFERKITEQYLALQLEKKTTKKKILESYLNTIGLGRGTNGVQAASHLYFNKDVWDLSVAESAVIAAITQRPTALEPIAHPENNKERQLAVLSKMKQQGYLTEAEYEAAKAEDVYSHIQLVKNELEEVSDYSYFVDETIQNVANDLSAEFGYNTNEAFNLIYRGGLSIYITQDLAMQKVVDDVFNNEENFPPQDEDYAVKVMYSLSVKSGDGVKNNYKEDQFDSEDEAKAFVATQKAEWAPNEADIVAENVLYVPQPQAAMVVIDYHTGQVKAVAGGRGQKIGNQTFDRATQAKRQPGSTFKVLAAYLPALDTGKYTLASVIDDVPFFVKSSSGTYNPKNWYDGSKYTFNYKGLSTVREGIENSMNILAVKTMADIGPETGFEYLLKLGFTTLVDQETIDGKVYSDKTLALPLGGLTNGVTVLELTAAYGAIANKGVYIEPTFYTKVLDHSGEILLEKKQETHEVMKESTAFLLTSAMESVVNTGTGKQAKFKEVKMPIAGKTGTTTDTIDLVFAGYTPYYVATVWMGYDQPEEMAYVKSYHKYIWRDVMEKIHENLTNVEFDIPKGVSQVKICTESGKLAVDGLCDADPRGSTVKYEYFAKGTAPTTTCDVHYTLDICTTSDLLKGPYCPVETIKPTVFIKRPIPLVPAEWDPKKPPRIEDFGYQWPVEKEGEICTIHGPITDILNTTSQGAIEIVDPNATVDPNAATDGQSETVPDEPTDPNGVTDGATGTDTLPETDPNGQTTTP